MAIHVRGFFFIFLFFFLPSGLPAGPCWARLVSLQFKRYFYQRNIGVVTAQSTCYLFLQLKEKSCCRTQLKHQVYCHRMQQHVSWFWQHCCATLEVLSDLLLQGIILKLLWNKIFHWSLCSRSISFWKGESSVKKRSRSKGNFTSCFWMLKVLKS